MTTGDVVQATHWKNILGRTRERVTAEVRPGPAGLKLRCHPEADVIMFPLLQERRGDFAGTVLYHGDEYDILRARVPRLAACKAGGHWHHFQRPHRR